MKSKKINNLLHIKTRKVKKKINNLNIIIIPFREQKECNRNEQLKEFLNHMKKFFKNNYIKIFIIEQNKDNKNFNRGKLLNIGFIEANKYYNYESSIFHDVDLLPSKQALEYYSKNIKSGQQIHMINGYDYENYKNNGSYNDIFFGGVTMINNIDFKNANGFPNDAWGWGGEDDQMRLRIKGINKLNIFRPKIPAYLDIHNINNGKGISNNKINDHRNKITDNFKYINGLTDIEYSIISSEKEKLNTIITLHHLLVNI